MIKLFSWAVVIAAIGFVVLAAQGWHDLMHIFEGGW